ncbi:MAG: CCDC90 family protein [Gammaproteobacteria bacterium]|nr:CCDC90 family protein [Gammaproteobacteria bacterium]
MTIFLHALGLSIMMGLSSTLYAEDLKRPETMDEMWEIIKSQQEQINTLQEQLKPKIQPNQNNEVTVLKRQTSVLAEEVEKLRTELFIPEEAEYKSQYGLGPAASKVYQTSQGLSIGGYGEANYQGIVNDKGGRNNNTDFERLVLYVGYKFTDNILFNSEIEIEHSSTDKTGSVSVEFAALDFFIDPMANIRAGMVLVPMGFINPIHEPPFFFGNNRPEVERRIIPSTWREIGAGLFGELYPNLTYTTYVVNGLDANGFSSSGIRGGRQKGSQARAEDIAFVGRLDYAPEVVPGLSFGGSAYVGGSGQAQSFDGQRADVFTQLYEAHLQWKYRGLEFRTLGSWGSIGNAADLSAARGETIGESNFGWYAEIGYDILPLILPKTTHYLAPFFRFEMFDTIANAPDGFADDDRFDRRIFQVGLHYKPIPNVVIKADYRNFDSAGGDLGDDVNLGVGFIF